MTNSESPIGILPDGSENYGNGIIGPSEADVKLANQFSNELAAENIVVASKGSLLGRIAEATLGRIPKPLRRFAIPAAVLAPLIAAACGEGNDTEPKVQNGANLTPPGATEPIPPTLAPVETSTSTPPLTPEVKQEVPCEILPQEFCSQAERVVFTHEYLDPPVSETYIALNLPEGVPILSPVDGLVEPLEESGDPFSGLLLWIRYQGRYDDKIAPFIRGDIRVDSMVQRNVKKGDIIGYTGNTGVRNLGASLLFTVGMETPTGPATNEEFLRELFH